MSTELDPVAGQWYRHLDKGQLFVVTNFDEVRGLIEIQHYDGDLEEIDAETWPDLELELAEAPEDWTGPADDVETDDLGYTETEMADKDWPEPLEENPKSEKEEWEDLESEDEQDEWAEGDSTEDLYGADPDR
jgi:Family of unknown function (DUF6763)